MKYFFSFLILVFFLQLNLTAQEDLPVWKKLRYLSEEEMYLPLRNAEGFIETEPPGGEIRNVAEFDPMQAVLVRYPFGVPFSVMKEIAADLELITIVKNANEESNVRAQYENQGVNLENCSFLHAPTNSWWVRDYGPWFVFDGANKPGIMDFPYNRPRPNDNDIPAAVAEYLDIDLYGMNLYHTGGNYMTDGLGKSSSTDLIIEENPSLSEDDINNIVRNYLDIEDYYVMYDPLDDYIKHIDCWGKFLTPGKVIIGQVPETDYRYADFEAAADFFKNTVGGYGIPYEVYRVYTPGGNPATPYTNCLIVNNKVLVPLSGGQWDDEAIASYKAAMPGYKIVGIEYNGWYNTDALHCRTKGVADLGMLYIDHMPTLGLQAFKNELTFTADVTAYSGVVINQDAAKLHYRVNDGDYETSLLSENDEGKWTTTISELNPLDQVDYYIEVTDASGRMAVHPFIGEADPHEFELNAFVPELIINPDTLYFNSHEALINGLEASIFNNSFGPTKITGVVLPVNSDFEVQLINFPQIPYEMGGTSTLNFKISFLTPLPEMGTLLTDMVLIQTELYDYPVYFTIDRTGVGLEDTNEGVIELMVAPNPSSDIFHFNYELHKGEEVHLSIFSLDGKVIYQKSENQRAGKQQLNWNIKTTKKQDIKAGMYHYTLKLENKNYSGSIMVNK